MPTTTGYEFGDVVLVPFPFTDQSAMTKRPAVVVSSDPYNRSRPDVIVLAVTSQKRAISGIGEAEKRWGSRNTFWLTILGAVATVSGLCDNTFDRRRS